VTGRRAAAFSVRPARLADARAIASVHVESWRGGYRGLLTDELLAGLSVNERELRWRERLAGDEAEQSGLRVDVAVDGESVLGFVAAGPSRETGVTAHDGEIRAIYVHPAHWSAGVGQALLGTAVARLLAAGTSEVLIWVLRGNARACRFYELAGWTRDGGVRRKRLAGPPELDNEIEEISYRREIS
jgi:ribosomal protein S18 acetylase RimI-like enzyme